MVSNRMFLLFLYLLISSMFLNFFSEILDSSSVFLPFDLKIPEVYPTKNPHLEKSERKHRDGGP